MAQSDAKVLSPELRALKDQERELRKLVEHPAWGTLRLMFEVKRNEWKASIATRLLGGGPEAKPLDQRELDYKRGYFAGTRAVLDAHESIAIALSSRERKEGNG